MNLIKKFDLKNIVSNDLFFGERLFLIGIFFLPSALPIGGFFLLCSIFISIYNNDNENLIKNEWNFIFLICISFISLSTFYNCFFNLPPSLQNIDKSIILLNLFNWIPIYIAFLTFQIYLKNQRQRLLFQRSLIAGTIPVLVSCVMHKFLNIYGPFETLFGTIVWFNYSDIKKAAGLFSNPNYLGMWLTICLPFAISLLRVEKVNFNKVILLIINFLIICFAILSDSRNAFFGIFISLFIVFGIRKVLNFTLLALLGIFIFHFFLPNLLNLNENHLFYKLTQLNPNLDHPRIKIWQNALNLISQRPLLGWGPGTLPYVTSYLPPYQNYQHSHNLIIEIAFNFGIPIAIIIFSTILKMMKTAFIKIKSIKIYLDDYKICISFLASFIVFLIAHLNDITYYDGKISIIFSILLAGLKNIIEEKTNFKRI